MTKIKKKDKSKKVAPSRSGSKSPAQETADLEASQVVPNSDRRLYCQVFPLLKPTASLLAGISNIVPINYDSAPVIVHNEHFTGYAVFRCNNFDGHMPIDSRTGKPMEILGSSEYFSGHRRTFSLQISGRFRREWSADDVMFGTFFEKPIKLPPGYQLAIRIAKKIDASMDGDLACSEPYMCSPLICAMNVMRADPVIIRGTAVDPGAASAAFNRDAESGNSSNPLYLPPWQYGGSCHLEENFMATVPAWPEAALYNQTSSDDSNEDPAQMRRRGSLSSFFFRDSSSKPAALTPSQRRSWFLKEEHRRAYKFHPDTLYSFDFNNQYVDLNRFELKLGLSIDVSRYLNGQPVRYQMRSRDGSTIFFTIELGRG
jgi:hypothetical protein